MGETAKRIISAAFLIVFFLVAFLYPGFYYVDLLFFGLFILFFGLKEFYQFAQREESQSFKGTGYFYSLIIILVYYLQFIGIQSYIEPPTWLKDWSKFLNQLPFSIVLLLLILAMFQAFFLQIIRRPLDGAMMSVTTTVFSLIYITIPIGHFFLLLGLAEGVYYIFFVCVVTLMCDTGAYFGGKWIGRHPAGLKVSPKKTWEGYFTGCITSILSIQLLNFLWLKFTNKEPAIHGWEVLGVSLVFSLLAILGDLAESALKRDAKVKDSSTLIPGHGGVLDLGDALLFTIPALYYYLKIKESINLI